MRSSYGTNFSLTLFGESHGPAVGFVLDGLPAGIELDLQNIRDALTPPPPGGQDLHPAPGGGRVPLPLRVLQGPHLRHAADLRHREHRPALGGLRRDAVPAPPLPRGLRGLCQVRRLSGPARRRPLLRPGHGRARRGGRDLSADPLGARRDPGHAREVLPGHRGPDFAWDRLGEDPRFAPVPRLPRAGRDRAPQDAARHRGRAERGRFPRAPCWRRRCWGLARRASASRSSTPWRARSPTCSSRSPRSRAWPSAWASALPTARAASSTTASPPLRRAAP